MMIGWIIAIALIFGLALLWLVSKSTRRRRGISEQDRRLIINKWQEIEQLMRQDRAKEAIFEADKLLDHVFKKINLPGDTFADRLKSGEKLLSKNYQDIWAAHKLRNKLAHEIDFRPTPREAQTTIDTFDRAIRHLTAL